MKRNVPGLSDTARDSHSEVPDGIFLVRLDGAQHRWQSQKRFYLLRSPFSNLRRSPGALSSAVSTAPPRRCGSWVGSCVISSTTPNC